MAKHRVPKMPRVVLRVNLNEIGDVAKFAAEAVFRFSTDAVGVLIYRLDDGREFQAHRTKTSVVIWSSQAALPNPLSTTRKRA